jgi:hypothetical protein
MVSRVILSEVKTTLKANVATELALALPSQRGGALALSRAELYWILRHVVPQNDGCLLHVIASVAKQSKEFI